MVMRRWGEVVGWSTWSVRLLERHRHYVVTTAQSTIGKTYLVGTNLVYFVTANDARGSCDFCSSDGWHERQADGESAALGVVGPGVF
jgi:hypothetical protein